MKERLILILFGLIGVLTVAMIAAFLWVLSLGHQIQSERSNSIIASCTDQNHRHDKTDRKLEKLTRDAIKKHPEQAAAHEQGLKQTESLIQALAPKQNCQALVDKYVHQGS